MRTLFAFLIAVLIEPAWAQERQPTSRIYAGAGLASLDLKDDYHGVSYDDFSAGWQVYGGYWFRDALAIELGYKHLGEFKSGEIPGSGIERLEISADFDAVVVRALAALPLGDLLGWRRDVEIFGTAGYYDADIDRGAVTLGSVEASFDSRSESGLMFGAGVLYKLRKVDMRGYVERLDLGDEDAWDIGVAVQFSF